MAWCSSSYAYSYSYRYGGRGSSVLGANNFIKVEIHPSLSSIATCRSNFTHSGKISFTWDDVINISQTQFHPHSSLHAFLDKIKLCNRGAENVDDFIPFVIQNHVVGYVHDGFAGYLRKFPDVFIFPDDDSQAIHFGDHVRLHSSLSTHEDRTNAVGDVIKCLGEELIPGIRNELYPVMSSFGTQAFFSLERAAAPYFGIKAYGVHMNGFVEKDGQKYLWIGKRNESKPTYPGMLDHLVAGGLPHGISCGDNLVKECEEEAGIVKSIASQAIPVGVVSYMDIDGYRYKRDVLFCYDLKLPESFVPKNQDGEVGSFRLIPVQLVADVIQKTEFFKPNCNLVIIDFLFRHGNTELRDTSLFQQFRAVVKETEKYIKPEDPGYLELLHSLRKVVCS